MGPRQRGKRSRMSEKGVVRGLGLERKNGFSRQATSGSHLAKLVDKQDQGLW